MNITKTKITSSKGDLSVVMHYPKKETDRLAILCPGFLDSKDYKHLRSLADMFSGQGYVVVRFDPTGTWESEGDISDYTNTQYLEDIKSILEDMLRRTDFKQILLGGHSRGGQMSILYAARDPRISCVLGIMPSCKPITGERRKEWEETGFSISQRDLPNNQNENKEYRVPNLHLEDRDKYNTVEDVKKVKAPIILLAGELDKTVPPEDVKEIFVNANEPKKVVIIPGIGHDYRHNDKEIIAVNEKILEQLKNFAIF